MNEQKIDALIVAIEKLVEALTVQQIINEDPATKEIPANKPKGAPTKTTRFTQEELKKFCLGKVRENANFKSELAEVLKAYDAKTLSKLTEDQIQIVAKMVGMK